MDLLLIAICILGFVCLLSLHEAGKAHEWMSDYNNQRKFRKAFGQEGIHVIFHDYDRTVSVSFSGKGASYSGLLSWTKACALYESHPQGHGLRKTLTEIFK
ncbi:hypothetical protein CL97_gp137 [Cronobacter phage CR9]|uniref:Uncharacterized protein n=1 Tax=Cronobacter phage CR9 TaxID=1162290 RepID=M1F2B7_9CAUD|nr:hypothetical protein CL97_gp137 [Cronobacter phage CR9]AFH21021.1 hypothetical protein CR9_137 [Cronobacter phage CR9]